jgi:hypothetical protein
MSICNTDINVYCNIYLPVYFKQFSITKKKLKNSYGKCQQIKHHKIRYIVPFFCDWHLIENLYHLIMIALNVEKIYPTPRKTAQNETDWPLNPFHLLYKFLFIIIIIVILFIYLLFYYYCPCNEYRLQ